VNTGNFGWKADPCKLTQDHKFYDAEGCLSSKSTGLGRLDFQNMKYSFGALSQTSKKSKIKLKKLPLSREFGENTPEFKKAIEEAQ